jgi:hypothetical protein
MAHPDHIQDAGRNIRAKGRICPPSAKELTEMRKLVTIAATTLALSTLGLAAPAFADHNGYGINQGNQYDYDGGERGDNGRGYGNDRNYDFGRHEGNFDRWERGWDRHEFGESRHHGKLSYWRIVRRLEAQGFYGVRGLRPSRYGFGWRAFAFTGRGRPVMLHINPYTGRVLNVRYV